ncbi:MAG: histidine kinase [Arachnia sp.]
MNDFRWSRDGRMLLRDVGLAAALAVGSLVPVFAWNNDHLMWRAVGWSLLMCAAVALRRVAPLAALGVIAVAGLGMVLTITIPVPALIAVPIVAYSVGRYHRLTAGIAVGAFALIGSVAGPMTWTRGLADGYRFIGTTLLVLLSFTITALWYLAGRLLRERQLSEALDREIATERFTAARRQSEQETELAAGRARAQVAQELHDVLAHSLSVIVVQAEGAKALTQKRPEAATEALGVIADTGRKSIAEVRRIVAVMRGEDEQPAFGPAPSLSQVPELIASAGDRITLTVTGEAQVLPESLSLAAFRVVQEAVTNFLKHAGPTATAIVELSYTPRDVLIVVRDDGIGVLSKSDGRGSGVRGMRERVQAMGGDFRAGPRPGGGFEVQARLPLPAMLGSGWLKGDE